LFHPEEEINFEHFDVEGDSKKGVKVESATRPLIDYGD
jgi:hypothetical protein